MTNELLSEIQSVFSLADSIKLFPSRNYKKEPPSITLIFPEAVFITMGVNDHYNNLYRNSQNGQFIIKIITNTTELSIHLIDPVTSSTISVNHLTYNKNELFEFDTSTANDWGVVLLVGTLSIETVSLGPIEGFIVCNGFSITS